jgi:fatty-acyl-CoA synthase
MPAAAAGRLPYGSWVADLRRLIVIRIRDADPSLSRRDSKERLCQYEARAAFRAAAARSLSFFVLAGHDGGRNMDAMIRRHTLSDLLHRSARRHPDKTAIACGETRWSYAQFDAVCTRLAAGLAERGIAKGVRVAVLARNSHAFAAMRFALARLGAVLVPINFMLKAEEAAYILRHAGARMLATDSGLAETARNAAALDTEVRELVWLPSEEPSEPIADMVTFDALAASAAPVPAVALAADDLAQIVYTSGTESSPKGAMLTHDAVISQYVSCVVDASIEGSDLALHALPLYHCAQLDVFLGPSIYVGATNVITAKPTPDNLLPLVARHGITSFFAPPTVWIALLRSPLFDRTDLGSLRKGYYGASIMPVEVLRELAARLPQIRLWNLYGQTEIAPLATMLGPEDQLRKPGSCGRAVLNVETRVVDDAMRDVAPGAVGEIVHRSPHLMLGYFHDDERTRAAFDGGWFHSGDLATIDAEGYITVVDRKKDMIKSGGENVASREVEEAIYKLPQVSEVAVVGLPHPRWVEAVTAIVVVKAGHTLDEAAVLEHCNAQLASFKAPKRVVFVEALPKNPSGKLLKRELRQRFVGGETLDKAIQKNFGT